MTDKSLDQIVVGGSWTNNALLLYSLRHEIHHRVQMTVLMRQAGVRVPDVLGSTRVD